MIFGTIFEREAVTIPRRLKHFVYRAVVMAALFSVICTTWLLIGGIQQRMNMGDLSRLSALIFQILVPLHLVFLVFVSCLAGCTAVSHEKDRRTLVLLLMTTLSNWEIVIGKLSAGMLNGINLLLPGILTLLMLSLFGGVSPEQVYAIGAIGLATILASSAWGTSIALWREKTFQAIAISLLGVMLYLAAVELLAAGKLLGLNPRWADTLNPIRACIALSRPIPSSASLGRWPQVLATASWMLGLASLLIATSVARLRIWNPSREARPSTGDENPLESFEATTSSNRMMQSPTTRLRKARRVWDNPVLWREMCTWAYGRKVLLIRFAYLAFGVLVAYGLYLASQDTSSLGAKASADRLLPTSAILVGPLLVVSMIIINALAVNSITNERDGQALELLLVSEISPSKFLFGKLLGVLYVAKEMVLLPIALAAWLWWNGGISGENFLFLVVGLIVVDIFVVMLGLHCGMIYSRSMTAIATSLGTVFFLFLGIATCMLIMISFRGSFGRQLAPFLAIILGGGTGLYVALGSRNPSPAITLAAFGLPFMTFFALTSFMLRGQELTVVSSIAAAYGFATLAMLVPALSEFEFSFERTVAAAEPEASSPE